MLLRKGVHGPCGGAGETWSGIYSLRKCPPRGHFWGNTTWKGPPPRGKVLRAPVLASVAANHLTINPRQDRPANKNAGRKSPGGRRNLWVPRHPELPPAPGRRTAHQAAPCIRDHQAPRFPTLFTKLTQEEVGNLNVSTFVK